MGEQDRGFKVFVGVDLGSEAHDVCAVDLNGGVVGERRVEHSGDGLARLAEWLTEVSEGEPTSVGVGIEVPRGAVVETLLEHGFRVFSINPKQLDRFRDRHSVAGAKDDRRDAFVLADSLRTDRALFHAVDLGDPQIIELRELSRMEDELKSEFRRQCNQILAQLHRYFPQVLRLSSGVDEPWVWQLLELVPTPKKARSVKAKDVQALLKAHRIRRLTGRQVMAELRKKPLRLAP